jgi:hypothetical protein
MKNELRSMFGWILFAARWDRANVVCGAFDCQN